MKKLDQFPYEESNGDSPELTRKDLKQQLADEINQAEKIRERISGYMPEEFYDKIPEYCMFDRSDLILIVGSPVIAIVIFCVAVIGAALAETKHMPRLEDWAILLPLALIAVGFTECVLWVRDFPNHLFCTKKSLEKARQARQRLESEKKWLQENIDKVRPIHDKFFQWDSFLKKEFCIDLQAIVAGPYHWQIGMSHQLRGKISGFEKELTFEIDTDSYDHFVKAIMTLYYRMNLTTEEAVAFERQILKQEAATNIVVPKEG